MNKKIKGILASLVVLFALVGVGGVTAFASGNLILNIGENQKIAMEDLAKIVDILKDKNEDISDLESKNNQSNTKVTELQGRVEKLTSDNSLLKTRAEKSELIIKNATDMLSKFEQEIDSTDGTKHKLELAVKLLDDLSKDFGQHAGLTELKNALNEADSELDKANDNAEKSNLDLEEADKLMEEVKDTTQDIIEEYGEE